MKCIHCGNEINENFQFCTFCGGRNLPRPAEVAPVAAEPAPVILETVDREAMFPGSPQPTAPQPGYPQQLQFAPYSNYAYQPPQPPVLPQPPKAPAKKGGGVKWVLAWVWLTLAVAGWAVALVLLLGPGFGGAKEADSFRIQENAVLTESTWYQWERQTDTLYQWKFHRDGTAEYGPTGSDQVFTVSYSVDEDTNAVIIGYSEEGLVWEYDPVEGCYWKYEIIGSQTYKTRIFAAQGMPHGIGLCYSYRVDNGWPYFPVSYEKITRMNRENAEKLVERYNFYLNYWSCMGAGEQVTGVEAENVLRSAGCPQYEMYMYTVYRVGCCDSLHGMYEHLCHYIHRDLLGDDLLRDNLEKPCVEYNGQVYYLVLPMGYGGYYLVADPVEREDGVWSVEMEMSFSEGERYTALFTRENGTYKLTEIYAGSYVSEESRVSLEEEMAWALVKQADYGFLLNYFKGQGELDESLSYALYPEPDFEVKCHPAYGIYTKEDLRERLSRHFTQDYIDDYVMNEAYYSDTVGGMVYGGRWFQKDDRIYFEPNWGAGHPMLLRETMQVTRQSGNAWRITVEREFMDEVEVFYVVYEDGSFKIDSPDKG